MGSYKCSKCGATFDSRDALREHIYQTHISDEDSNNFEESGHEFDSTNEEDLEE